MINQNTKVRVKANIPHLNDHLYGREGVTVGYAHSYNQVTLPGLAGKRNFFDNELEIIQEEKNVFKVGDKVKTQYVNDSRVGEILFLYNKGKHAVVRWSTSDEAAYSIDGLRNWNYDPNTRNPLAPSVALTLADIKPGLELRRVHRGKVSDRVTVIQGEPAIDTGAYGAYRVKTNESILDMGNSLGDMGVVPYNALSRDGRIQWNEVNYSIPNTAEAVLAVLQK